MNGHGNINAIEATEHLKNILNVGKGDTESAKLNAIANGDMEESGESKIMVFERVHQKIDLCTTEDSSHLNVFGNEVDIYSSPLGHETTCSQVILEDMVVYGWEEKYYPGKLINMHLSGLYFAYVLKPNNKPGYVRVVRTQLDLRHLIKDYRNDVKDIAFAHTTSQVLLGSVDACGELLVHKISDDGSVILCNLLIRILRSSDWLPSEHNRLIWCLYVPDDNENSEDDNCTEDVSTLLVVTHNERAEIWNVETIIKEHGYGNLAIDDVNIGVQVISDHKMPISCATFSPDGTALSIGSIDGVVKFFQVNTLEKEVSPRCLHQWTPHPQKLLSSLYFLDNLKNHRPDVQFWKFAVTGAENNTELKVWSCETWTCLQTIRIHGNPADEITPCLKAEMDLSSKYLFLSDISRKVLFIFHLEQEPLNLPVIICSVSEYRVPLPVLSLTIADITSVKSHSLDECKNSDDEDQDQMEDILNDADENSYNYKIKLFWIQTKSLQFCRIMYKSKLTSPLLSIGSISSLSQDSFAFKDALSDISMESRETSSRSLKDLDTSKGLCVVDELSLASQSNPQSLTALPSHISNFPICGEVLLTPDDFTSPSHLSTSQNSFSLHEDMTKTISKCDTTDGHLSEAIDSLPVEASGMQRRKSSQHSATSSPSREVAEILAPSKVLHLAEIVDISSGSIDAEPVNNNLSSFVIAGASGPSRNQQEYRVKDWPQAPDPTKDYRTVVKTENELPSHNQHFHPCTEEPSAFQHDINMKFSKLSQNFVDYMLKLDSIVEALRDQRCEFQSIQNEVKMLRQDQKLIQTNSTKDNLFNNLEHSVNQNLVSHHSRLEHLIVKMAEEEMRRSAKGLALMSDEVSGTFAKKLENSLKQELATNIVPQMNKVLDAIAQKMQLDFDQKLTTTDANLRENFMKHLKGKVFMDNLSQTLSTSFQGIIQVSCRDVFQNSVVPSFDKACQHLFQQLNEQFNKGIGEYVQILEKQTQKSCSDLEKTVSFLKEEVNNLVLGAQQGINTQSIKVENHSLDMMKQHEMLLADIRHVVQEEVKKAMREQNHSILNSRSVTPVPLSDPQLQKQAMMQLVKQGNFNEAFQQALSAMDLQLVLYLCESVSLDQVFGSTPCLLQQHVLLSLVNQLSTDLSVKTEIKVRYIEDVIASLDSTNSIIKDHIGSVLENLQQRISNFLLKNPNHKFSRNLKRISLAINALIKC